jgi:hypothetical protein
MKYNVYYKIKNENSLKALLFALKFGFKLGRFGVDESHSAALPNGYYGETDLNEKQAKEAYAMLLGCKQIIDIKIEKI